MSTVSNTNSTGVGSLPQAMIDSNVDGTDISIQVSGTITLAASLPDITNDYEIDGTGYSFVIDINGYNEALRCGSGKTSKLISVRMTNANRTTGYFLRLDSTSVFEFNGCTLLDNNATSQDGALMWSNVNPVSLTITNCTITDVHGAGGSKRCVSFSIDSISNVYTITNSTFTDCGNHRIDGGTITITNNSEFDNNGMVAGGSIITSEYSSVAVNWVLTDSTFKNNSWISGGALHIDNYDNVTIERCTFDGNTASTNYGGAVRFDATNGLTANVLIKHCTFKDNLADDAGGAVYIYTGAPNTFKFDGCTFTGNDVTNFDGGAIHARGSFQGTNKLEFINCTFDSNTSGRWGGCFRFDNLTNGAEFTNCTFVNNSCGSANEGGVMQVDGTTGAYTVDNCLIYGNTANSVGNSFDMDAGTLTGKNNLMDYDGSSSFTDGDANGNKVGTGYTFNVSAAADNGGLVYSCKIASDSDAKDAGDNLLVTDSYDARGIGYKRKIRTVDIGAFEIQPLVGAGLRFTGPYYG